MICEVLRRAHLHHDGDGPNYAPNARVIFEFDRQFVWFQKWTPSCIGCREQYEVSILRFVALAEKAPHFDRIKFHEP